MCAIMPMHTKKHSRVINIVPERCMPISWGLCRTCPISCHHVSGSMSSPMIYSKGNISHTNTVVRGSTHSIKREYNRIPLPQASLIIHVQTTCNRHDSGHGQPVVTILEYNTWVLSMGHKYRECVCS